MLIQMPLNSAKDVDILADNGANEFYCGIIPFDWNRKYGYEIPLNCRGSYSWGNFQTIKELEIAVSRSHRKNIQVIVTLNEHSYNSSQMNYILDLCDKLEEIKVDGVVVSNIPLLIELKNRNYNFKISISAEANCTNEYAVEFFKSFGAKRIVFPRHMLIEEMKNIIEKYNDIEFEAFIYNEGCYFAGGHCYSVHHMSYGPLCRACNYTIQPISSQYASEALNKIEYQTHIKHIIRHIDGCTKCGLCSIKRLKSINVDYVKIVGRTMGIEQSLKSLAIVNEAISISNSIENYKEYTDKCKEMFCGSVDNDYCNSNIMCYYPNQNNI